MVQVEVIDLNPNQAGGGDVPQRMKMRITQEPKVGWTISQAVNSSLSIV